MSTTTNTEFIIGQYRVGKCIGEGTFGKVRLGIHITTDQKVAVKTLQKDKIVQPADVERVTRQINILKILRHPNVIQLYEIIETKADIHLIMEYADGGQLFDYIVKRKRLEETEAIFFMQQIIAGVEYIHKNGIVHRDLKPENLLLDHNKNVKIVDFGLSNQYKNGEKLKTACGSPCYAAPEMIAGKKYECIKVDIWSCGIILYAMLCGYLPFEDPNTSKLYKKIMAGDYEVPRLLTHDSKDILKCILNVSPESRYTIEQIRSSKWYNLTNRTYVGAGILVGKDQIDVNERLVQRMAKDGLDPHQIKSYVASNRHNYITAYYYLLKKKAEIDPSVLNYEPSPTKSHSRGESPLIYRPDHKRDGFIPQKKVDGKEKANISRTNDSFDIASSLAEAHKNKFLASTNLSHKHAKQDSLDKFQNLKLFPKKKTASIYEQSSQFANKGNITTRSQTEDKLEFSLNRPNFAQNDALNLNLKDRPTPCTTNSELASPREETSHKKRRDRQTVDHIQISPTADRNMEFNKHSPVVAGPSLNSPGSKNREPLSTSHATSLKIKTKGSLNSPTSINVKTNKTTAQNSITLASPEKQRESLEQFMPLPKVHSGPFNCQCLFVGNPRNLLLRIVNYLSKHLNMKYQQTDAFSIKLSEYEQISVESIQGIVGYYLVKFTISSSLNAIIIEYLSK